MTSALQDFDTPPGGWTTDDLDDVPQDGRRRELIDGVLWMSPAPNGEHQEIVWRLTAALDRCCPAEYRANQGVEVRVSTRRSYIPDVLVTTSEAARRLPQRLQPTDVILAVEIESPSSYTMDRVTKPALYASVGIPHYWRISRDEAFQVHVYRLDPVAEVYRQVGVFGEELDLTEPWALRLPVKEFQPRD